MLEDLISDVPENEKKGLPSLVQPTPTSEIIVEAYLKHFHKADSNIEWLDAELEFDLWLCPKDCEQCGGLGYIIEADPNDPYALPCTFSKTLLVGRIDAVGKTADGELFFMDLKTKNPPPRTRINEWKQTWRMSPQALTYAIGVSKKYKDLRRFTVRMCYKSNPPSFDFEWFRLSAAEIAWWKTEILRTADEIRRLRKGAQPWPPNFQRCFKYGQNYVCPFFEPACSKLDWNGMPEGAKPRILSHLQIENEWKERLTGSFGQQMRKGLVILDATRLTLYECREAYRREYEEGGVETEKGIAADIGIDFHNLLDARYKMLIKR